MKIKIVHILGSGHCGSTLLDLILSSHSQMIGIGEVNKLFSNKTNSSTEILICTCGKSEKTCPLWKYSLSQLDDKMKQLLPSLKLIIPFRSLFKSDINTEFKLTNCNRIKLEQYININYTLYSAISKYSKKKILIDSSKDPYRAILMSKTNLFENYFIHMIRDGRGVFNSYKKKYKRNLWSVYRWLKTNLRIEIIKRIMPDKNIIQVKYEDLVRNPTTTLKILLSELNLDFEETMLDYRKCKQHQIGGNRMRKRKDNNITEDISWKNNFKIIDYIYYYLFYWWLNKLYRY